MVRETRFAFDNPDDYQLSDMECRKQDSLDQDEDDDWLEDLNPSGVFKKKVPSNQPKKDFGTNPQSKCSEQKHLAGADWLKELG